MQPTTKTTWELTVRGRVIGLLASLAVLASALTGDAHARFAGALLGGVLVVDLILKLAPTRIHLQPTARQVEAGQAFVESLELENRGPLTLLDFRVTEPRTATGAGGALVRVMTPGARLSLNLPSRARSRGHYEHRSLSCDQLWPFALIRKRVTTTIATALVVEPARIDLPNHLREALESHLVHDNAIERSGDAEFWMLREYSYGEDLRAVHALRSAASGTLVRRLERGEESQHVWVVLDLRRAQGRPQHGIRRFEWSLSAAAQLADDLEARKTRFTCLVLGKSPRLIDVTSDGERREMLAMLAGAAPEEHCPIELAAWPDLGEAELCLWIPAGGARASAERALLPDAVLVTQDGER